MALLKAYAYFYFKANFNAVFTPFLYIFAIHIPLEYKITNKY